ncbi:MAG: hypothetical protein KDC90_18605 [Ignavibacteriae bacterium]|nr:hypothetical protein [Ignavibacteriota bacterium]
MEKVVIMYHHFNKTSFTFLRYKIFYSLSFFLFMMPSSVSAQIRDWEDSGCMVNGVPTLKCFEVVVGNLLIMTSAFVLLVLFIMFVIGSFKYLTSLGNPEQVESAKNTFKWAIIGLIVYVSAYLILNIIDILFLGGQGDIFRFTLGE